MEEVVAPLITNDAVVLGILMTDSVVFLIEVECISHAEILIRSKILATENLTSKFLYLFIQISWA